MSKRIMILMVNKTSVMESVDIYDILKREELEVDLVSMEDTKEITLWPDLKIQTDKLLSEINLKDYQALIVPGGPGHTRIDEHKDIDSILKHFIEEEKIIGAICAGPTVLGKRGYYKNKNVTSFPGVQNTLQGARVLQDPVVVDGNFVTAKNNMTSALFSIELLRKLVGESRALLQEKKMK